MGENNDERDAASSNSSINITYETIFELLRREKNRDELQKLDSTFQSDILSYIEEKNKVFLPQASDTFSEAEREKTIKQVSNTKRMVIELFERREKKIIILALNKIRTSSAIIDLSAMLSDEKDFFYKMVTLLGEYRAYNLNKMINNGHSTVISHLQNKPLAQTQSSSFGKTHTTPQVQTNSKEKENTSEKNKKTLRIISKVPKFMGKELEVYGPFNPDDMASLPLEIADVLIKKGRAEEINVE